MFFFPACKAPNCISWKMVISFS
jgi:hypothetical protein